jgi:TonB family protein
MRLPKCRTMILISLMICGATSSYMLAQQSQHDETIKNEDIYVASLTEMIYPPSARLARKEGIVVVRVKFDADGKVASAEAISGPKDLITDSLSNAKKWRFHPNSAKSAVIIYEFRIDGLCSAGSHFIFREPNIATITGCNFGSSATPGISPN